MLFDYFYFYLCIALFFSFSFIFFKTTMLIFLNSLFIFYSVIISVLYFTMLERKIMSYIQLRKGPNKVGPLGLLTPISDAIKLLFKVLISTISSNEYIFWFSPVLAVFLLLVVWSFFPISSSDSLFFYSFLLILCSMSLNVYVVLFSG